MTNSQAEKLTKLIELAWDNGWQQQTPEGLWPEYKTIKMFTGAPIRIDIEFPPGIRQGVTGLDAQNVIIFDHQFIKALCKAKYGEQVDNPRDSKPNITMQNPFHERNDLAWHAVIAWTAISTNRIDYLYGEFCE